MKDLDFDELDRAVNSLITNKPASSDTAITQGSNQPTIVAPLPTLTTVPSRPAVERPSTGRFMDVVHPSSDMRTALVMPERTTIQTSIPSTVPPTPIQKVEPPVVLTSDKDDDSDIDRISNDITNTINQTTNDSLESPFLSGAKVEKRPLNAFSAEPAVTTHSQFTAPMLFSDKVGTNTDYKQAETNAPLPAELQSDLLSIESGETTQVEDSIETPKSTIAPVIVDSMPIEVPVPVAPTESAVTTVITQPTIATSASIPQQYTEQPSSGDKDNGAIYDTNAYHKAMVSPVKKKSGWMWIVWIVILMVASVGAGVAVYFFVLPAFNL